MLALTFTLLVLFQLKHFLADYPLQGSYMLRKFLPDWGFFLPLFVHANVHGLMTMAIVYTVEPRLCWLGAVDAVVHFAMDRLKASPRYLGRFKALSAREFKTVQEFKRVTEAEVEDAVKARVMTPERAEIRRQTIKDVCEKELRNNTLFWWSLGFDQMIHHLTDLFTVYMLVRLG